MVLLRSSAAGVAATWRFLASAGTNGLYWCSSPNGSSERVVLLLLPRLRPVVPRLLPRLPRLAVTRFVAYKTYRFI